MLRSIYILSVKLSIQFLLCEVITHLRNYVQQPVVMKKLIVFKLLLIRDTVAMTITNQKRINKRRACNISYLRHIDIVTAYQRIAKLPHHNQVLFTPRHIYQRVCTVHLPSVELTIKPLLLVGQRQRTDTSECCTVFYQTCSVGGKGIRTRHVIVFFFLLYAQRVASLMKRHILIV